MPKQIGDQKAANVFSVRLLLAHSAIFINTLFGGR